MAFSPIYILILIGTIVVDYIAGIMIENAPASRRKLFLVISIFANVGVLVFFKYFNFLGTNINILSYRTGANISLPMLKILLPIGLSFHTFQAMSYTIEVYRGNQKAEKHFGIYALYVMFYPQLVAGPIERPQNMLHQFHEKHDFNFENCKVGLRFMLWGLFKKIVIADRLAIIVKNVYDHPSRFSGVSLMIATIFFAFEIYCDFSGYSDIAIGAAKVMGFNLMNNFKRPYFSKSLAEFWSRWHISLSTWFRDYLYIPLGGNRRSNTRNYINLAIVFLISGLWHGARWTFIAWGAFHAFGLIAGNLTRKWRMAVLSFIGITEHSKTNILLSTATTFFIVTFGWIFFTSHNMHDASYVITHILRGWGKIFSKSGLKEIFKELGSGYIIDGVFNVGLGTSLILLLEYFQNKTPGRSVAYLMSGQKTAVRWGFYYLLIISILVIGVYDNQEFIYFQF